MLAVSWSSIGLAFSIRQPAGEFHFTSAFRSTKSVIFRFASITVAWFLPPISLPISGYDIFVYLRARCMLNERASETVRSFFDEWMSAVVMPK